MEIEVWSVGKTKFTADPEFQEPMIREAIDQRGDVADVIIDYTDSERSDISHDEYVRVAGDLPGLIVFEGWLSGDQDEPPPAAVPAADENERLRTAAATETALRLAVAFIEQVRDGGYGDLASIDAAQVLAEIAELSL